MDTHTNPHTHTCTYIYTHMHTHTYTHRTHRIYCLTLLYIQRYNEEDIYLVNHMPTAMQKEWQVPRCLLCGGFTTFGICGEQILLYCGHFMICMPSVSHCIYHHDNC